MEKKKLKNFEEQVALSVKDLQKYPEDQLKILAKKMQVKECNNKRDLCYEIAKKLIFINRDKLPAENAKCSRYTKKLSKAKIKKIRKTIYKEFKEFKDSVWRMTPEDLQRFFTRYDQLCFNGDIESYIKESQFTLNFKTSGEPTFTTEGICVRKICNYTITIPVKYFSNVNGVTIVAGHPCKDQLECLLRVIEHEMVHLIIFMFCGDPFITDQHGELFMKMVKDLFEHTDFRHYIF